jgi:glycosyltransferase 2 family protein
MTNKKFKHFVAGLILAALALYFPLSHISISDLLGSFKTVRYEYLLPAAFLSYMVYIIRTYRWKILVSSLKPVKTIELLPPMMIGLLGNLLPLRLGEVFRAYLLKKKLNIPFAGSLATIMVERIFDIIMLLSLFSWILVARKHLFPEDAIWFGVSFETMAFKFGVITCGLLIFLIFLTYFLIHRPEPVTRIILVFFRIFPQKWEMRLEHLLTTFTLGLNVVRSWEVLIKTLVLSILEWIFVVLAPYPLLLAVGVQNKSLEALILLTVIISIAITALPTPAFLGAVQIGAFLALHRVMGESELVATTYGMIAWAWGFVLQVVAGVAFMVYEHVSIDQMEEEG